MVLNATFKNISAISWRSVLLVEQTGVPGEKTNDLLPQVTDKTVSHIVVSSTPHMRGFRTNNVRGDGN